jgi:hypothetical protein
LYFDKRVQVLLSKYKGNTQGPRNLFRDEDSFGGMVRGKKSEANSKTKRSPSLRSE